MHAKHHATDEVSVAVYELSLNSDGQPSHEQFPSQECSTESKRASIASHTNSSLSGPLLMLSLMKPQLRPAWLPL